MYLDPMLMKSVGEEHLEELRREAEVRRALAPEVAQWRKVTGRAMLWAGTRLLRERQAGPVMEPLADCGE